jgi:hypothetical protein
LVETRCKCYFPIGRRIVAGYDNVDAGAALQNNKMGGSSKNAQK